MNTIRQKKILRGNNPTTKYGPPPFFVGPRGPLQLKGQGGPCNSRGKGLCPWPLVGTKEARAFAPFALAQKQPKASGRYQGSNWRPLVPLPLPRAKAKEATVEASGTLVFAPWQRPRKQLEASGHEGSKGKSW
jgi:hypothetical protein